MENGMNNFFENISQTTLKSVNQLMSLNTRVMNKAIERQAELGSVFAGGCKQQAKVFQLTQDPKALVEKQSRLAEQYAVIYTEAAKTNMAITLKTGEQYKTWFNNNSKAVKQVVQNLAPNLKTV